MVRLIAGFNQIYSRNDGDSYMRLVVHFAMN
jgi:hypothetical protein